MAVGLQQKNAILRNELRHLKRDLGADPPRHHHHREASARNDAGNSGTQNTGSWRWDDDHDVPTFPYAAYCLLNGMPIIVDIYSGHDETNPGRFYRGRDSLYVPWQLSVSSWSASVSDATRYSHVCGPCFPLLCAFSGPHLRAWKANGATNKECRQQGGEVEEAAFTAIARPLSSPAGK